MYSINRQKGLSISGWLLILLVGSFFMLCAFRMAPAYLDNSYIQDGLLSFSETEKKIDEMSDNDFRRHMADYMLMNNVRSLSPKQLKVHRDRDRILLNFDYEIRVPIVYNIDVVMTFKNQWDSSRPFDCCKPAGE